MTRNIPNMKQLHQPRKNLIQKDDKEQKEGIKKTGKENKEEKNAAYKDSLFLKEQEDWKDGKGNDKNPEDTNKDKAGEKITEKCKYTRLTQQGRI